MKKQDNAIIGIYKITSPSGKIYIGQSINIEKRWEKYQKYIENIKNQIKLYNSLKKYGWEQHKFEIVEKCEEFKLLERETHWKIFYKVLEIPSLCCRIDGKGGRNSKETNKKIGDSHRGRKYSDESKLKISNAKKGVVFTDEHKRKISEAKKGKTHLSNEAKIKIGEANKNKIRTSLTKEKISSSMKESWKNNLNLKNRKLK
jgi:group I intron endonuclease